jgi:hypothetical protein
VQAKVHWATAGCPKRQVVVSGGINELKGATAAKAHRLRLCLGRRLRLCIQNNGASDTSQEANHRVDKWRVNLSMPTLSIKLRLCHCFNPWLYVGSLSSIMLFDDPQTALGKSQNIIILS